MKGGGLGADHGGLYSIHNCDRTHDSYRPKYKTYEIFSLITHPVFTGSSNKTLQPSYVEPLPLKYIYVRTEETLVH